MKRFGKCVGKIFPLFFFFFILLNFLSRELCNFSGSLFFQRVVLYRDKNVNFENKFEIWGYEWHALLGAKLRRRQIKLCKILGEQFLPGEKERSTSFSRCVCETMSVARALWVTEICSMLSYQNSGKKIAGLNCFGSFWFFGDVSNLKWNFLGNWMRISYLLSHNRVGILFFFFLYSELRNIGKIGLAKNKKLLFWIEFFNFLPSFS